MDFFGLIRESLIITAEAQFFNTDLDRIQTRTPRLFEELRVLRVLALKTDPSFPLPGSAPRQV
jgi:hypothetical protein